MILKISLTQTRHALAITQNYRRKRFAILSFKDAETQEKARDTAPELGNTILEWHELSDKLCAICNASNHLAAQCEIKGKSQEKRQQIKDKTQRLGNLYQRFKPAGTSNIWKNL